MSSLFLLIFASLIGSLGIPALCGNQDGLLRFQLISRHGLAFPGRPVAENRLRYVQELLRRDAARKELVSETLGRRRRATEVTGEGNSFTMSILSGAYAGTGEYFVHFQVGTPAQKFLLIADTGSDLTWMKCRYRRCVQNCSVSGGRGPRQKMFDADRSSSFTPVECSSTPCRTALPFSLSTCPTPASPCAYDYGYVDGSEAKGFYANESATVILDNGRRLKLKGVVIGCTSSFSGASLREADGVLGLGRSEYSFATKATDHAGGKFSYCLVDHLSAKNVSSYLTFGSDDSPSACASFMRHTPLELGLEPFYSVRVLGVSVGDVLLQVPSFVWDAARQGGVILDSGTSLTTLAEPAYRPIFSALSAALEGLPRAESPPFEFCFNATAGYSEAMVPRLALHLQGDARFQPHVRSYVIDVAEGLKCIGLMPAKWPAVSTIGNILQQNFLWEFDLRNRRVGFQPSTCS